MPGRYDGTKHNRQREAQERQEEFDKLSLTQKLDRVRSRRGKSMKEVKVLRQRLFESQLPH